MSSYIVVSALDGVLRKREAANAAGAYKLLRPIKALGERMFIELDYSRFEQGVQPIHTIEVNLSVFNQLTPVSVDYFFDSIIYITDIRYSGVSVLDTISRSNYAFCLDSCRSHHNSLPSIPVIPLRALG